VKRCLLDASVLIDLDLARLLGTAAQLDHELFTVDLVLDEVCSLDARRLLAEGLDVRELVSEQVASIIDLRRVRTRLSTGDAAALVSARHFGAFLLTGDARLRQAAEEEGIRVHGTLWLLREFVHADLLEPGAPPRIVDELRAMGRRLPKFPDEYLRR